MLGWFLLLALLAPVDAPAGRRVELKELGATLFVPDGYKAGAGDVVDVILHLHGSGSVVEPALVESGLDAVLIEFNRKGLSSVYTAPFSDPSLFPKLLDVTLSTLKSEKLVSAPKLGRVVVSSFSAGFGGVRALLKDPASFHRIDGLIMADSIYCGYTGDPAKHMVDTALMEGFRKFAAEAAEGRKTFLLTHSAQIPEGYASTTETADFLIKSLGNGGPGPTRDWGTGFTAARSYKNGKFVVFGFGGEGPNDHMIHLRQIRRFWKLYSEVSKSTIH